MSNVEYAIRLRSIVAQLVAFGEDAASDLNDMELDDMINHAVETLERALCQVGEPA